MPAARKTHPPTVPAPSQAALAVDDHVLAASRPLRDLGDKTCDILRRVGKLAIGDRQSMESESGSCPSVRQCGYSKFGEFVILQEAD